MIEIFFGLAIYVCFGLICFQGGEISNCIYNREDVLQRLNNLRGVMAIEIVIGHIVKNNNLILYPFNKFMIIAVAFFFFVSAFGMTVSYEKEKQYLRKFHLKILYFLSLIFIFFIYNMLVGSLVPRTLEDFPLMGPFGRNIFGYTNWYMWELLIFYILFWIIYAIKAEYADAIIAVITILGAMIVFKIGSYECWYASAFAFPFGLIFGKRYNKLIHFLNSMLGRVATVVLVTLGLCSLLLPGNSLIGMVYLRNVIGIAVIILLIYMCGHFRLGNNISRKLGKYSTEIYLSQFIYLTMAEMYQWDYKVQLIFMLVMVLLTSWILHPLIGRIRNLIKG